MDITWLAWLSKEGDRHPERDKGPGQGHTHLVARLGLAWCQKTERNPEPKCHHLYLLTNSLCSAPRQRPQLEVKVPETKPLLKSYLWGFTEPLAPSSPSPSAAVLHQAPRHLSIRAAPACYPLQALHKSSMVSPSSTLTSQPHLATLLPKGQLE